MIVELTSLEDFRVERSDQTKYSGEVVLFLSTREKKMDEECS
jgi:hypothetical protein